VHASKRPRTNPRLEIVNKGSTDLEYVFEIDKGTAKTVRCVEFSPARGVLSPVSKVLVNVQCTPVEYNVERLLDYMVHINIRAVGSTAPFIPFKSQEGQVTWTGGRAMPSLCSSFLTFLNPYSLVMALVRLS
jgi:hypothetical protein